MSTGRNVYRQDWSGARLTAMIEAVKIPDADFCELLGLKPSGLVRWREEGVPKKYMKRVARLLGWNLVYPDWAEAPLGSWVTKAEAPDPADTEDPDDTKSFEVKPAAEDLGPDVRHEIGGPVAGFAELVEAVTKQKVTVHASPEAAGISSAELTKMAKIILPDLARHQIVATPTLEQTSRPRVMFRND